LRLRERRALGRVAKLRRRHAREDLIRRTEGRIGQVVKGAIDGAQPERARRIADEVGQVFACGMRFGDLNLLQDEFEV
jgi:hypothetical protein